MIYLQGTFVGEDVVGHIVETAVPEIQLPDLFLLVECCGQVLGQVFHQIKKYVLPVSLNIDRRDRPSSLVWLQFLLPKIFGQFLLIIWFFFLW